MFDLLVYVHVLPAVVHEVKQRTYRLVMQQHWTELEENRMPKRLSPTEEMNGKERYSRLRNV